MTSTTGTTVATLLAELSNPNAETDGIRHDHNVFALATTADCYSPDGPESPGALFLAHIARDVAERVAYPDDSAETVRGMVDEILDGDAAHEIADGAVPIYTHDRWATFVDLGAYNEDITELGEVNGDDLTTSVAGVALYMIADRLVRGLAEEIREALDEIEEDDDDQGDDDA